MRRALASVALAATLGLGAGCGIAVCDAQTATACGPGATCDVDNGLCIQTAAPDAGATAAPPCTARRGCHERDEDDAGARP